jgi:glyoxylase-like metal-dependent hydrolase (beta-lactamase superfamily II)
MKSGTALAASIVAALISPAIAQGARKPTAASVNFAAPQSEANRRALDIYFIDVEGGAATLIVTPAGESMLIDAGWDGFDGRDAKRIQQAMRQAGITTIDHLVVTHYHGDHYGGVPELAKLVPIKRFYDHGKMTSLADDPQFAERYGAYQAVAKDRTTTMKPGDTIQLKPAVGAPRLPGQPDRRG